MPNRAAKKNNTAIRVKKIIPGRRFNLLAKVISSKATKASTIAIFKIVITGCVWTVRNANINPVMKSGR